jgi:hypothetical protein
LNQGHYASHVLGRARLPVTPFEQVLGSCLEALGAEHLEAEGVNAPALYQMLAGQRGWSPERYERFLADTWRRLLLAS